MTSTSDEDIPEELVLAAVERAERHRTLDIPGVPIWEVLEHLDVARRGSTARRVKAHVAALEQARALKLVRSHGLPLWALTAKGRKSLEAARGRESLALPASPQHRRWRQIHERAEQELERVHLSVGDLWEELDELLVARVNPGPSSDAWFQIGDRLARACSHLGSVVHCCHEWPEPSDDAADYDDEKDPSDEKLPEGERQRVRSLRMGRRDITRWKTSQTAKPPRSPTPAAAPQPATAKKTSAPVPD